MVVPTNKITISTKRNIIENTEQAIKDAYAPT